MFGRESLRDLIRTEHESLRDLVGHEHESLRELIRSQHEESMRVMDETREFNREILLRNEKIYKPLIAEIEEGRKEIQANTRAVLSVLDRLEGSGGSVA